ncbi:MAG TPA: hypothetical protein VKL40_03775 [Candidatus Angelobacter sp.]|nr:hypothetical protein [Candidatus Angelobacter sp.]
MTRISARFFALTVLLATSLASAAAQLSPCYAGFEISPACITERGLDQKVAAYQHKITEAMWRLGASYKINLRVVNDPAAAGYDPSVGDVFTDVVRNEEMRNQSFIINVTADFLEKQPEILFEASSLHELCHVMNDDLTGYHRNAANPETAEEHCVFEAVGESRYQQYLKAHAAYRHWDTLTYDRVLQRVKNVVLVPAPSEIDEADRLAQEYFRKHADGEEHLLVYNGELHDVSLNSTRDTVRHDPEKLRAVIKAGRPMIFFHNHPPEDGRAAMFPSYDDFGVAGLLSFMVYRENPGLLVEFRVIQLGKQSTIVSYGFKGPAVKDIKKLASEYRNAASQHADTAPIELKQNLLDYHLAQDAFNQYLQYVCPVDLTRKDAEVCRTHPEYFLWPSDRFFVHYRPPQPASPSRVEASSQ